MFFGPYSIDINRHIPLVVPLSQNDKGNELKFLLFNGEDPYEIAGGIVLNGRKPSGQVFSYPGTYSGNAATFEINEQMTAEPGQVVCEIVNSGTGGSRKGSANFILYIERDPMEDAVVSETDLSLMSEAIAAAGQVEAIVQEVEQVAAAVQTKAEQSDLTALDDAAFKMRGILESSDLNDVMDFGTYQIILANTYANTPQDERSGMFSVFRYEETDGAVIQMFMGNSNLYYRRYASGTWAEWIPVANTKAPVVTAGKITAGWTAWRRDRVGIITFNSCQLPAGTYTNSDVLMTVSPPPVGMVRALVVVGSDVKVIRIATTGAVTFNNSVTLSSQVYVLGQIVYPLAANV